MGLAHSNGECTKAAQLHSIPASHSGDDLVEDGFDEVLDIPLVEVRILRKDTLHQLGFDHRRVPEYLKGDKDWQASQASQAAAAPLGSAWRRPSIFIGLLIADDAVLKRQAAGLF
jgi:hypothetical protein